MYDHNGNILKLKRNGKASATSMDDLKYYYYNQAGTSTYDPMSSTPTDASNKLAYVTDAVSSTYTDDIDNQSSGNYTYDKIGQLISDAQEGINTIAWTVYNKIRSVTRNSGSTKTDLEFKYDAAGNRMLKIAKPRTAGGAASTQEAWTYTYYLRDASGNVMATYERSFPKASSTYEDKIKVKEQHIYGSSRVGIHTKDLQLTSKLYNFSSYNGVLLQGTYAGTQTTVTASNVNYTHTVGKKSYELSNHLGNVLVTVSDARIPTNSSGTVTAYAAVLKAATDYSAFGAPMENRTWSSSSYRYGFNGKEKENELHGNTGDAYDFEARIYDARLGRFFSIDSKSKAYPGVSNYSFCLNNSILFVDKSGNWVTDKDGRIIYTVTAQNVPVYTPPDKVESTSFMGRKIVETQYVIQVDKAKIITNEGTEVEVNIATTNEVKEIVKTTFIDVHGTSTFDYKEITHGADEFNNQYNCTGNSLCNKTFSINADLITDQVRKEEGLVEIDLKDAKKGDVGMYIDNNGKVVHLEIFKTPTTVSSKGGIELDPPSTGEPSPGKKVPFAPGLNGGAKEYKVFHKTVENFTIGSIVSGEKSSGKIKVSDHDFKIYKDYARIENKGK